MSVAAPPVAAAARDHFVHFYEEEDTLASEVARFLRTGIESGCGAIMIATPEHREAVLEQWRGAGFDSSAAVARERLIMLDARETLDAFCNDGQPDAGRFDRVVGNLIRRSLERCGDLVAFGEMVSLLWNDGHRAGAVHLEKLWNALATKHRFALYCAYSMRDCGVAGAEDDFRQVCDAHSHILPPKPIFGANSESDHLRLLAELGQKAAALEHELALRRQAEARLAEREADLSDFFENAPMALHRVGADGTILWANRAELQMLGYQRDEYVGHHISHFHADKEQIARVLRTLASGRSLKDEPCKLICRDGSIRHALVSSNAQMEDGRFIATRCFTRDVTDRWLAQEALRERAAVLHLALQGANMGYWIGELDRNAIRLSAELADLLGVSATNDWPVESFIDLMHPEDRAAFRSSLAEAIAQHGKLRAEFRVHGKAGAWRRFEVRGEGVYDQDGRATRFYGICADITDRPARTPTA
jgi:PAS domain S-box-containing protein